MKIFDFVPKNNLPADLKHFLPPVHSSFHSGTGIRVHEMPPA